MISRDLTFKISEPIMIGFRGEEILSDDLQRGAVQKQFILEGACLLAIRAGVDILWAANNTPEGDADDPDLFVRLFEAVFKRVKR